MRLLWDGSEYPLPHFSKNARILKRTEVQTIFQCRLIQEEGKRQH